MLRSSLQGLGVKKVIGFWPLMEISLWDQGDGLESIQMFQLWALGALDNTGDITVQGRQMVEFLPDFVSN